jgi:hypothetical protein
MRVFGGFGIITGVRRSATIGIILGVCHLCGAR